MADLRLPLLLIIFVSISHTSPTTAHPTLHKRSRTRAYIEAACRDTRYPDLCVRCLTGYVDRANVTIRSPQDLAQYALAISLYRARYTRAFLLKVAKELKAVRAKEYLPVKDCLDQINLCVDQLSMSVKELRRLGHEQAEGGHRHDMIFWHISNVETWVSSALTDASNCVDAFPGRRMSKLKATVKGKVQNVAELTSNALALFHRFASRYRATAAATPATDAATTKKP